MPVEEELDDEELDDEELEGLDEEELEDDGGPDAAGVELVAGAGDALDELLVSDAAESVEVW